MKRREPSSPPPLPTAEDFSKAGAPPPLAKRRRLSRDRWLKQRQRQVQQEDTTICLKDATRKRQRERDMEPPAMEESDDKDADRKRRRRNPNEALRDLYDARIRTQAWRAAIDGAGVSKAALVAAAPERALAGLTLTTLTAAGSPPGSGSGSGIKCRLFSLRSQYLDCLATLPETHPRRQALTAWAVDDYKASPRIWRGNWCQGYSCDDRRPGL